MSDINFNNDKFKSSNFDPLKATKAAGMTWDEHLRIVRAGIEKMGFKQTGPSNLVEFFQLASAQARAVRTKAAAKCEERFAAGVAMTEEFRVQLAQETGAQFLDTFVHYGKDELLIILTQFLTEQVMKELT